MKLACKTSIHRCRAAFTPSNPLGVWRGMRKALNVAARVDRCTLPNGRKVSQEYGGFPSRAPLGPQRPTLEIVFHAQQEMHK